MSKIIEVLKNGFDEIIPMNLMEPLQVAIIVEGHYDGHYVMRTSSSDYFEVMSLTDIQPDCCWYEDSYIKVRPLVKGESIIVEFGND